MDKNLKLVYQNTLSQIAFFFFTLFKGYKGNKLYEKNSKEKVLMEARENKFQIISQALLRKQR